MLSFINTCLIVEYATCLNSSVVDHLISVQEVPNSSLDWYIFVYAYVHLLPLQHLIDAVHEAILLTVADAGLLITFFIIGQ